MAASNRNPNKAAIMRGPEGKPTKHVSYTTGAISLTSGQITTNNSITITNGRNFVCRKITWRKTGAFQFNVKVQREDLFSAEIDVRALVNGDASGIPFLLDDGVIWPEGEPVIVALTDNSGAANTVEIVFHGEEWDPNAEDIEPKS